MIGAGVQLEGLNYQPHEPAIRAFEKYAYEIEFNAFIKSLEERAVSLAIQALGQKDEIMNRWLGGRAQELLEIVGAFSERRIYRESAEFLGGEQEDPLRGVAP